jgi:hypothetical protein
LPDSPFLIGIDLGTTNSAVAFVDTRRRGARVQRFAIPQLTEAAVVEAQSVLPSFLYFGEPHEVASGALALPWNPKPDAIVGVMARERGALAPARQVTSAKSWLAHPGVDRRAAILPWGAESGPHVSPVDASSRYLMHVRDAWNAAIAGGDEQLRLERQRIVLTVPASFDEEARELTVEAARLARFDNLTLLEEPIAAFYAWARIGAGRPGRPGRSGGPGGSGRSGGSGESGRAGGSGESGRSELTAFGLDGDRVALVCDVGGGTTDFSLIRVRVDAGVPAFERIAIGDHLLLGGDNVDLALATLVERRMGESRPDVRLAITQRSALRRLCSGAKERMLGESPPEHVAITVLGSGRAVIGASITVDLARDDVQRVLEDFLPVTAPGEIAAPRDRRAGLRELGLPYESDPAITRHLAGFLARSADAIRAALIADRHDQPPAAGDHQSDTPGEDQDAAGIDRRAADDPGQRHRARLESGSASGSRTGHIAGDHGHPQVVTIGARAMVRPDLVLFNGGFFTPAVARDRVVLALAEWFGEAPVILTTENLEAAVAVGAATYARLRAGIGPSMSLVKAGSGRAYYIGLRAARTSEAIPAVCVLGRGTDEGTTTRLDHPFTVITNRPISFSLHGSIVRPDRAGDAVTLTPGDDVREHAPLVTVLRYGRKSRQVEIPVRLSITFTELGTLELWCESQVSDHRWRLQFQLRSRDDEAGEVGEVNNFIDAAVVIPDEAIEAGERAIRSVFENARGEVTTENLVAHLEQIVGYGKTTWPLPAIRNFVDVLIAVAAARRTSPALEARWLNLFGFCFRPGFGAAKDPWRIGEARAIYTAGLAFPNAAQNHVEWLVLWQRVAGGFSAGQQRELSQRVMGELGLLGRKAARLNPQIERESWRLLASLERLDAGTRAKIGDELLVRVRRDARNTSLLWAIGRLGARVPLYGPLSSVVPPPSATRWLEALVSFKLTTPDLGAAIVQIGARTGDPLRDLDDAALARARDRLHRAGIPDEALRYLDVVIPSSIADANRVFGEPLPDGLRLSTLDAEGPAL